MPWKKWEVWLVMDNMLKPEVRLWVYRVTLAALPLLAIAGVISDSAVAQIGLLAAALLGMGTNALASMNVNTHSTGKHAESE